MKAMIFAAGRGERMRPLTDTCPKPLLCVHGVPLIVWHIQNLVEAGITDIVINHAHLGEQIEHQLGNGSKWGASIQYSSETQALETAGGVAKALHLLGDSPFVAIAADVFCPQFSYANVLNALQEDDLAYLYMVDNPDHHPKGDFVLKAGRIVNGELDRLNFSGIGVYRTEMFRGITPGQKASLGPLLKNAIALGKVGGSYYSGPWTNVGTPEQLELLNGTSVETAFNRM